MFFFREVKMASLSTKHFGRPKTDIFFIALTHYLEVWDHFGAIPSSITQKFVEIEHFP